MTLRYNKYPSLLLSFRAETRDLGEAVSVLGVLKHLTGWRMSAITGMGEALAGHVHATADGLAMMLPALKAESMGEEIVLLDGARRGVIGVPGA
jgi:hypothetical protein